MLAGFEGAEMGAELEGGGSDGKRRTGAGDVAAQDRTAAILRLWIIGQIRALDFVLLCRGGHLLQLGPACVAISARCS